MHAQTRSGVDDLHGYLPSSIESGAILIEIITERVRWLGLSNGLKTDRSHVDQTIWAATVR